MSQFSLPAKEYKLSEESAQAEVMKIVEHYELDVDAQPDALRPSLESALIKIRTSFREGVLEISDEKAFKITQRLKAAPGEVAELVYVDFSGKNKRELDGFKDNETYKRLHSFLGSITGLGAQAIASLKAVDLSIAEAIALVFLSA